MTSSPKVWLAVIASLGLQACVSAPTLEVPASQSANIQFVIDNREFEDMRVDVANDGARIRLGTVEGFATRTFTVSSALVSAQSHVSLVATTLAGATLQSPVVTVQPGQVVSWRIERASFGKVLIVR